jgi:hypothetical protein
MLHKLHRGASSEKLLKNHEQGHQHTSPMFSGCDYEPLLLRTLHDLEGKMVHPTQARSLSSVIIQSLW